MPAVKACKHVRQPICGMFQDRPVMLCGDCRAVISEGWPVPQSALKLSCNPQQNGSKLRFVAIHQAVMQGQECVATAKSKTFAKRIANALNKHEVNSEGV